MATPAAEKSLTSPEGVPIEEMPGWDPARGVLVHRTRRRERELERAAASHRPERAQLAAAEALPVRQPLHPVIAPGED